MMESIGATRARSMLLITCGLPAVTSYSWTPE